MTRRPTNRLRVARAENNITQFDLADKTKMSRHRYWCIENSYMEATDDEKDRLARALKATVPALFPDLSDHSVMAS